MEKGVRMGFEQATVMVSLDQILTTRSVTKQYKQTERYQRIVASIKEVGLVEPLVVHPSKGKSVGSFLLLDGHLRLEALRDLDATQAACIVSKDDETYTYNRHVNRLSTFQEHFMLTKALNNGVSEERLARALNIDVKRLREKRNLLRGICPEAVDLLQKRDLAASALHYFRLVKPMRQIAMAESMIASNNFTRSYAYALYAATRHDELVHPEKPRGAKGIAPADLARIEKEMAVLERDFRQVKDDFSQDSLNLAVVHAYLTKLLDNARVVRFLSQHHAELLGQFQIIVETESLNA